MQSWQVKASLLAVLCALALADQATTANQLATADEVLRNDVWTILNTPNFQLVIAVFAFLFGIVALFDGAKFFQLLVLVFVAAASFVLTLSQLTPLWTHPEGQVLKYVASVEVALFVTFAAWKGWEGTQLVLGLSFGFFLYDSFKAFAHETPYLQPAVGHVYSQTAVATFLVLLGTWMVHERYGAGRVLGFLAPIVGGSMLVAASGYFTMLAATEPDVAKSLNIAAVKPENVGSVVDFWKMIVFPFNSKDVGIYAHDKADNVAVDNMSFSLDRSLGLVFWAIIATLSITYQLRADRDRRIVADALRAKLIDDKP